MRTLMTFFFFCSFGIFPSYIFAQDVTEVDRFATPIQYLYVDVNNDNTLGKEEPLIVMPAMDYKALFHHIPLERMLRCQVDNHEYIVLNQDNLNRMDKNHNNMIESNEGLYKIHFAKVSGTIKGSYITAKAKLVALWGKIKKIYLHVKEKRWKVSVLKKLGVEEVDEIDFTDKKEMFIKSAEKRKDEDMPWMGL